VHTSKRDFEKEFRKLFLTKWKFNFFICIHSWNVCILSYHNSFQLYYMLNLWSGGDGSFWHSFSARKWKKLFKRDGYIALWIIHIWRNEEIFIGEDIRFTQRKIKNRQIFWPILFLENDVGRMETQRGEFHIAYRRNT